MNELATSRKVVDKHGLELVWVPVDAIKSNPDNWRTHGPTQLRALGDLIFGDEDEKGEKKNTKVGWVRPLIVNRREPEWGWEDAEAVPTLIDGHGRMDVAFKHGAAVPCIFGSWTPAQETLLLATIDPVAEQAGRDEAAYQQLLIGLSNETAAVRDVIGLARSIISGVSKEPSASDSQSIVGEHGVVDTLRIGGMKIPLTAAEMEVLDLLMRAYLEKFGIAFGFVGSVLRGEEYVSAQL